MGSTYDVQEITVNVRGVEHAMRLHTPDELSTNRALLIQLSAERLDERPGSAANIPARVFLGAGCRVAMVESPFGGLFDPMKQAIARNVDIFAEFAEVGLAIVTACLKLGSEVVVCGTSRNGLFALHLVAADPRVLGASVFAPVTYIPALHEFHTMADSPIIQRANAESLLDRLAGRPLFVGINTDDQRVGTKHCLRFHAKLQAMTHNDALTLYTADVQTENRKNHRLPDAGFQSGAAFLLGLCARM